LRKNAIAAIILIVVTLFAWLLRDRLTLANFAMIYILVVFVIAIRLGTVAAMASSLFSFLSINFFLTKPYYTFLVADSRDVIELFVFIVVAVLAGQLGAQSRRQTEAAKQRADEQEILYRLTGTVNQVSAPEAIYNVLIQVLREDLQASNAYILPYKTEVPNAEETVHFVLLQAGERIYGTLCVSFSTALSSQQTRLILACAAQAALALQRIELAERVQTSQQFEAADRLKTALLRSISHDLRTPITVIKTSASNLHTLGERLSASEQLELYETIENEADHLNKLIGNLLDLSRLQAGAMVLNSELNSLEEVAGDVAARVWQMTGRERIQLRFPQDMPLVPFDYGLILQAVTNLVDNALRYEPQETQIEIQGCIEQKEVLLKVINHGETISPEERDDIMQPFYQGRGGHTGLGLPIAKGIVETHQGSLTVEDTPDTGATFVITLPLDKKENTENEVKNPGRG
jgi:two-component system, OmpR family, sensor histidine kinase KdpD